MPKAPKVHSLKRPAIERMLRVHNELRKGKFPNCAKLARELEVSSKTISRDIDFMRDRMLLPIEYEPSEHGFCYTSEVESFPTIDISEGELLALSIARKSLQHYKGTPFEMPLEAAISKIEASLPNTITANLGKLSESISFKQSRFSNADERILKTATQGVLNRRALRISYRKPGAKSPEERTVNPYHLTNYLGKWYMIAWDHKREAIRTFLLSRAKRCDITDRKFDLPSTFSPDDYLRNRFGIFSPPGKIEARIWFSPDVADYILENEWHETQTIAHLDDGGIEIGFKLDCLRDIALWILSWGTNAIAVSPPELQNIIKDTAMRIAKSYD